MNVFRRNGKVSILVFIVPLRVFFSILHIYFIISKKCHTKLGCSMFFFLQSAKNEWHLGSFFYKLLGVYDLINFFLCLVKPWKIIRREWPYSFFFHTWNGKGKKTNEILMRNGGNANVSNTRKLLINFCFNYIKFSFNLCSCIFLTKMLLY